MNNEMTTTTAPVAETTPAVDQLGKLLELVATDDEFSLLRATLELYTLEVMKG
jgi:hypothetical protein